MSNGSWMRAIRLNCIAVGRSLGIVPLVLGAGLCSLAALQEPEFFRRQGLDLAWPCIYASADFCGLVCCAVAPVAARASVRMRIATGLAAVFVGILCLLALTGVGLVTDLAIRADTPWGSIPAGIIRFTAVWTPIALLSQSQRPTGSTTRFLLLLTAYLVQCGVHPASLHVGIAEPTRILAAGLALVGSLLALLASTP